MLFSKFTRGFCDQSFYVTQQTDLFHRRNINLYQWQMFKSRSYYYSIQLNPMAEWLRWWNMKQHAACSIPIGSHFFSFFLTNCLIFVSFSTPSYVYLEPFYAPCHDRTRQAYYCKYAKIKQERQNLSYLIVCEKFTT